MASNNEIIKALKDRSSELQSQLASIQGQIDGINTAIAALGGIVPSAPAAAPAKKSGYEPVKVDKRRGPKPGSKRGRKPKSATPVVAAPVAAPVVVKAPAPSKAEEPKVASTRGRKANHNLPSTFKDANSAAMQILYVLNESGKMSIREIIDSIAKYTPNEDKKRIEQNVRAAVRSLKLRGTLKVVGKNGREEIFDLKK